MTESDEVRPRSAAQIGDELIAWIDHEALKPGDRIGAERELADRYGVSRWAIRKALERLENEGLVIRTNGRSGGVFVAHKRVVRDLADLVGLPRYIREQGMEAGTSVLGTQMVPADDELAKVFEIPADSWVVRIDRLRLAAGLPLSVESIWCPAERFPGLLDHSLVGSLYELLETEYGIERGDAVETISATHAERVHAAALQVPVNTPLLTVSRTARLASGEVFEHGREYYRADRIAIVVHTSGSQQAARRYLP